MSESQASRTRRTDSWKALCLDHQAALKRYENREAGSEGVAKGYIMNKCVERNKKGNF
jgi:hypothetical protein